MQSTLRKDEATHEPLAANPGNLAAIGHSACAESSLRVIVLATNPNVLDDGWGAILRAIPQIGPILVCAQTPAGGAKAVVSRLRRNLIKHGLLFVPYRLWAFVSERPRHHFSETRFGQRDVLVEKLVSTSIHSEEVIQSVRNWNPDVGLSIGAPVLRSSLFTIPRFGTLNIHCGEVPRFRGAPPAFWELLTGADRIGATLHRIDEHLDTGDIIDCATVSLYPNDTLEGASDRAFELGRAVFERGLLRIVSNPALAGIPQEGQGNSYRQPLVATRMALGLRLAKARLKRAISPRNSAKTLTSAFLLGVVRPIRDLVRSARGNHPVRVFTFHRVTDLCRDGMTISPSCFEAQLKYIAKIHDIVSLDHAIEQLQSHVKLSRPLAVIAFDDAYKSVYTHAAPILRSRGLVATCFAATGFLGTNKRYEHDKDCVARDFTPAMSWDELRELRSEGWTVGSHTVSHARLSACDHTSLDVELGESKNDLERAFGPTPLAIAYPFGSRSDICDEALAKIRHFGYTACLGDFGGENFAGADPFTLNRIDIGANHATMMWKLYANGYNLAAVRSMYAATSVPPAK